MGKNIVIVKYHRTFSFSTLKNIPQAEIAVSYFSSPGLVLTLCLGSYMKEGMLGTSRVHAVTSSIYCIWQTNLVNAQ